MKRRLARITLLASILPIAGLGYAGTAQADDPGPAPKTEVCLQDLETGVETCYPEMPPLTVVDEQDVRRYAGRSQTTSSTEPEVGDVVEGYGGRVVIGIFYGHTNKIQRLVVYVTPRGCDNNAGAEWGVPNVGVDFNDRFASGESFSQCNFKVWQTSNYGGPSFGWRVSANTFLALNDEVTSVKWR